MCPVAIEMNSGKFVIIHKCEICGKEKRQHCAENDNMDAIINISKNNSFIFGK